MSFKPQNCSSPAVISGPISGGKHGRQFTSYLGDISKIGYIEEEYFLSGQAASFVPQGELTADGKWSLSKEGSTPYQTRIFIQRPLDSAKFNGTVLVEWMNVSFGYEHPMCYGQWIYENGYAIAYVAAQSVCVHGISERDMGLIAWDSERYGSLSIPNDSISYDIFTQAAQAVGPNRNLLQTDPMNGLAVKKLIALGYSQSGSRLHAYANGVQPIENVFDAIIPIANAGAASDFKPEISFGPGNQRIVFSWVRDDLSIPVLVLNSEHEAQYYQYIRQPDSDRFRSYEVAGTGHVSRREVEYTRDMHRQDGINSPDFAGYYNPSEWMTTSWMPIIETALDKMDAWINGEPVFFGTPIQTEDGKILRDKYGNAIGGVRLPELEVPIACYDGTGAGLGGKQTMLSEEEFRELYPSREEYAAKVAAAAKKASSTGLLLPYHADAYIKKSETDMLGIF